MPVVSTQLYSIPFYTLNYVKQISCHLLPYQLIVKIFTLLFPSHSVFEFLIVKPIIIFTFYSYVDFKHTINLRGAMNCATTNTANLQKM